MPAHHRGLRRRLGDHRIAGGERCGYLPHEDRQREIPWADAGTDATAGKEQPVLLAGRPGQIERRKIGFGPYCVVAQEIDRSEEHTSELQSLMRISYAVFCLKKKK